MSIVVPGPHEEFFNSAFGIWMGGIFFRWLLNTNQGAQSMEGLRNKAEWSGKYFNSDT